MTTIALVFAGLLRYKNCQSRRANTLEVCVNGYACSWYGTNLEVLFLFAKPILFCLDDVVQVMWNTHIWSKVWIMLYLTKLEVRLSRSQRLEMKSMGSLGNSIFMFVVNLQSQPLHTLSCFVDNSHDFF